MFKVALMYNHPTDVDAFEKYYAETHIPLALKIPNLSSLELTKFLDTPEGKAQCYRMAELCFNSAEDMQSAMASPEGQAAAADLQNFATGGVTFLIGMYRVEKPA